MTKAKLSKIKNALNVFGKVLQPSKTYDAEKVSEKVASDWLQEQALLLDYLSAPLHIT